MIWTSKDDIENQKKQLKIEISNLKSKPNLAIIQVGDDPSSTLFIKNKQILANELGLRTELYKYDQDIDQKEILDLINNLNLNDDVDGILVQLPLPNQIDKNLILNSILFSKDVDGLGAKNRGLLDMKIPFIISPTALATMHVLKTNEIELKSKNIVVIGDGDVAGRPISKILLNKGATVTVCNQYTKDLSFFTKEADILVSAVGEKHLIIKEMVKNGAILIDVGISIDQTGTHGDLDFENLIDKTSLITKTPGGIGPLTVFYLIKNLIKCYKYSK